MDKDNYRAVPFRFVVDEAKADVCKLEKLTNLFPDMKEIIALELFKFNNLTQTITRLSSIYTISSVVDIRDDTLHLFLGPYHLSLGPVTFGAMQFRNISTALLASSHSKAGHENSTHYHKRRHDAALRRFRRAVRKLIHIKSIVDKLRLASILTPYNQYKLYKRGIYDLVLAGHRHNSDSVFMDEDFREQLRSNLDEKNPLLASKFTKISTLLHLLAPSPNHAESNSTPGKGSQNRTDETNDNSSKSLLNSANLCCTHHFQNSQLAMVPINRSMSHQSSHFLAPDSYGKRNSKHHTRRSSSNHSDRPITNSLPDLTAAEKTSPSDKSKDIIPIKRPIPTYQEDAFVNRISTLMTNYLLSQEPFEDKNSSLSSIVSNNEFETLLTRIKSSVDQNLADNSKKTRQKTSTKRVKPSPTKRRLLLSSRSQSVDETNSQELNDHSIEL